MAIDVDNFAGRLDEGDAVAAFVATWRACEAGAARCVVTTSPSVDSAQRRELAEAVALRAEAVVALNRAYIAFRAELAQQTGADAERAINAALLGTATYATSLTDVPLVRTAVLGRPLEHIVGSVASAVSSQQRRAQTRRASQNLGLAIAALREAMALETRKYDALAEALVDQRTEAHRAMLQAGLISGAGTLQPFADRLNVPLTRDADAVVARSVAARTAVEAMVEANERREIRRTQARYRAAIATLIELEQVHAVMDRGERPDLDSLERAVWELERLSDKPTSPRALGTPLTDQPTR
ncbi:hypothetical protein GCM10009116_10140 [Brevundimonas basaltis]|uniref:Uncharacterized protein n=1 Tax=Brevundimonas basaltis TaxID=472166 RepID=A0A7W8MGV4_9CAUL|nr:hypothetical protein [Brevundimonas basaltis]MBB5292064.1 hypothetical protein [Brevundimonas basaltis]